MQPTEGPRSWREELTVSVEPGTRSGPLLLSISSGAAHTNCVLTICFSCSALICAAAEVSPRTVFTSHIISLSFARCWSVKLLLLWAVASDGLDVARGKKKNLNLTRPFTSMRRGFWTRDAWFTHDWKSSPLITFNMSIKLKWCCDVWVCPVMGLWSAQAVLE